MGVSLPGCLVGGFETSPNLWVSSLILIIIPINQRPYKESYQVLHSQTLQLKIALIYPSVYYDENKLRKNDG